MNFFLTKKISFRIFDIIVKIRIFLSDPDLDPGGKFSVDPTDPNPEHCLNDQHKKVVVKTVSNVILPVIIFIDQETLPVDKTQAKI